MLLEDCNELVASVVELLAKLLIVVKVVESEIDLVVSVRPCLATSLTFC